MSAPQTGIMNNEFLLFDAHFVWFSSSMQSVDAFYQHFREIRCGTAEKFRVKTNLEKKGYINAGQVIDINKEK